MRTKILVEVVAAVLAATCGASAATAEVVRIVKDEAKLTPAELGNVIYRHGGATVVREAGASDEDFGDVYAVNTYNSFATPELAGEVGEVLAFDPGNFAVMRLSPRGAAQVSTHLHQLGHACGVLVKLDGEPMAERVAAAPTPLIPIEARDDRVVRLTSQVDQERIKATVTELAGMNTRYHASDSGKSVADKLAEKYRALAAGRDDVTVSTYDHGSATSQKSLVVRIAGRTRPSEVIVLGSHIDSINMPWSLLMPTTAAPGADDNASGTATNLEIFRLLMEQGIALERTLEIHGYAAEEIGLVGSADIAKDYKDQGTNVVAMVQMDMTAYKASGAPDQIWFITDDTEPAFNDQLASLVTHYTDMASDRASLPMGSSDHASWRKQGFATAFPFENPGAYNQNIHTSNDTLSNATAFTLATGFAKLGLSYVIHFGGVD